MTNNITNVASLIVGTRIRCSAPNRSWPGFRQVVEGIVAENNSDNIVVETRWVWSGGVKSCFHHISHKDVKCVEII